MNIRRLMNDGHNETSTDERKLRWDEENRLLAVDDNGFVTNYWYDAILVIPTTKVIGIVCESFPV